MKYTSLPLFFMLFSIFALVTPLRAEGEGEEEAPEAAPAGDVPDAKKTIDTLILANASKDFGRIDGVMADLDAVTKATSDQETLDKIAKELQDSFKICKGNWGTLKKIVTVLGETKSKHAAKVLKKLATQDDAEEGDESELQALGLVAFGKLADPKNLDELEDMSKSRNLVVAKGAYEGFRYYGAAKGKYRKQAAEMLMKRLEMEYPSSGGQGGASVSADKQERYNEVSPLIVAAMQAIARQNTINDIENWREWWKEFRKDRETWKDD